MQTFSQVRLAIPAIFLVYGSYRGLRLFIAHDVSLAATLIIAISVFLRIIKSKSSFDTVQDQKLTKRRQDQTSD